MFTHENILALHSNPLGVMCQSFFRCEAARVLLGGRKTGQGVGSLSRFPVPLRPKALPGFSVLVVPNAAESARPKCAEFSAVWAYTVRGGFKCRGVKAGPQATAESGAQRPLRLVAKPPLELV